MSSVKSSHTKQLLYNIYDRRTKLMVGIVYSWEHEPDGLYINKLRPPPLYDLGPFYDMRNVKMVLQANMGDNYSLTDVEERGDDD